MWQKIKISVLVYALIVVGIPPGLMIAQDLPAVPLEDRLKTQYTLVKMGWNSGGAAIAGECTVLVIRKDGILGVPYGDQPVVTKYQDGTVRSPSSSAMGARGSMGKVGKQQTFQVGERVYPSRIAVNLPKDQVIISVVACDACNNVSPTTFYKADVVFQFPKGTLATTSLSQVDDTIAELLNIDDSPSDQGGAQGGNGAGHANGDANANDAGNQGGGGGQMQQAPEPEPQQIEKGQTPDQVKATLGQPDKIVNFGSKQIFIYKDLKVTFLNGKVLDVQ
jgi:hypothetical protein